MMMKMMAMQRAMNVTEKNVEGVAKGVVAR